MDSPKQMNEYWHIPRASLVPSVTSSAVSSISSSDRSNKSFSNPPTLAERTTKVTTTKQKSRINNYLTPVNYKTNNRRNKNEQHNIAVIGAATPKPSQQYHLQHPQTHHHQLQVKRQATYSSPASVKRGSRSSQGSNDSNNSTRSAASGSLLLTAANLERFAEIQKQDSKNQNGYLPSVHNQYHQHSKQSIPSTHHATTTAVASGAASVVDNHTPHHHDYKMDDTIYNNKKSNRSTNSNSNNNFIDEDGNNVEGNIMHNNHHNDSIIQMDPNLNFIKTKDLDTVSIASSMHFTMVNGESGQTKKPKRGLCDRGRQVTVLIVSMSTIFMLLIMGMVYALEMRAREMPQS